MGRLLGQCISMLGPCYVFPCWAFVGHKKGGTFKPGFNEPLIGGKMLDLYAAKLCCAVLGSLEPISGQECLVHLGRGTLAWNRH